MERFTVRNSEGIGVLKQPFECERCGDLQWSLHDLGNGSPIDKLAEYEDLEEQGKLLKLPCAVGDRIYVIDTDERLSNKEIKIYDIDNIVITSDGTILLKYDAHDGVICESENIITDKPYLDFYRCFLSQEEAEATLKELGRWGK